MGESFHIVQHLDSPFLFIDERVIFIPRGRQLDVNNRMLKLILVLDGETQLLIDGKDFGKISPGDAIIVPKPCRQNYRPIEKRETRLHVLRLVFDFNALGLDLLNTKNGLDDSFQIESKFPAFVRHHLRDIRVLKRFQDSFVIDCLRTIRREVEREEAGFRYVVSAQCRLLITNLIRKSASKPILQDLSVASDSNDTSWAVEHTKFFICENFNRSLTLGEIAWEVRLSAEHLSRVFKSATGQTVFDFLRDIRIESAKSYLISSKRSVTEISELVGFSSSTLLCRNFRKATGTSPSQFRQLSLKKLSFQHTTLDADKHAYR